MLLQDLNITIVHWRRLQHIMMIRITVLFLACFLAIATASPVEDTDLDDDVNALIQMLDVQDVGFNVLAKVIYRYSYMYIHNAHDQAIYLNWLST